MCRVFYSCGFEGLSRSLGSVLGFLVNFVVTVSAEGTHRLGWSERDILDGDMSLALHVERDSPGLVIRKLSSLHTETTRCEGIESEAIHWRGLLGLLTFGTNEKRIPSTNLFPKRINLKAHLCVTCFLKDGRDGRPF